MKTYKIKIIQNPANKFLVHEEEVNNFLDTLDVDTKRKVKTKLTNYQTRPDNVLGVIITTIIKFE